MLERAEHEIEQGKQNNKRERTEGQLEQPGSDSAVSPAATFLSLLPARNYDEGKNGTAHESRDSENPYCLDERVKHLLWAASGC